MLEKIWVVYILKCAMVYCRITSGTCKIIQDNLVAVCWEELSFWLSVCAVLYVMSSLVFAFLSHIMSWAGWGIQLYRLLIIVFSSLYNVWELNFSWIPMTMTLSHSTIFTSIWYGLAGKPEPDMIWSDIIPWNRRVSSTTLHVAERLYM